jgi:peptidoglycan/LPS O-acetylase OafA/YrhL
MQALTDRGLALPADSVPSVVGRIAEIEVLRAIAVLLVAVHHFQGGLFAWSSPALDRFHAYFNGGHGVDLFFAVSGFVIARDLFPRIDAAAGNRAVFMEVAVRFWIRRAWRLLPAAWLCLAVVLACSVAFNTSGAFGSFRANFAGALASVLQVQNLHFALNFGSELGLGRTYHFWSLSLEEQFYLALPFLIFFGRRWLPWIAAALVVLQLLSVRPTLYHWVLRTDALMLGVLIAWWSRDPSWRAFAPEFLARRAVRIPVIALLVGALATVGADGLRIIEHKLSLIALLSALLVLAASYDCGYLFSAGAARRVLEWVGRRSYGIYLWHVPVYAMVQELAHRVGVARGAQFGPADTLAFVLAATVAVIAVAEINYRLVEMPLRRHGARIAERWGAPAR